jgi:ABC-type transporter Mla MlaB component
MRRIPLVKSGAVNASIIPAKRNGNIFHSVMLLVFGVVLGALCVFIFVGAPVVPITSIPGRGEGSPIVVLDPPVATFSGDPVKTNNVTIVMDRSIPSLLRHLTSDLEEQREEVAYALQLGSLDYYFLGDIVAAGGVPILRGIIQNATETNEDVLINVLALLSSCINSYKSASMELTQDGFLRHLLTLAKDGYDDVKVPAAQALLDALSYMEKPAYSKALSMVTDLVWEGTEGVRDKVASWLYSRYDMKYDGGALEPGVILAIVQLLKVGSDQAKMHAAMALADLSNVEVNRRIFVDSGGVPLLVPVLTNRRAQNDVVRALLLFMTGYPETLAQVASAGLPILQRIVEQGAGVYEGDGQLVGSTYTLCMLLAADPAVAAQMVQAGMLPLWVQLSQEGAGEAKRQARRIVKLLSRVTAAQGQSHGQGNVPPPDTPSIRRRDP